MIKNKNSMLFWYPQVKDLVPTPKTILIQLKKPKDVLDLIDGGQIVDRYAEEIKKAANQMSYPCFFRNDLEAAKHDWEYTCFVQKEEDILQHLVNLVESSICKDLFFQGFAIREFLLLESSFKSHRGMPVSKEFRFFARDGEYVCHHPYWPLGAIVSPTAQDWKEKALSLREITDAELELLKDYSMKLTKKLGGYWSCDFCKTKDSKWFMTDMAVSEDSYHWGTCKNAPPIMLHQYGEPDVIEKEEEVDLNSFFG